MFTGIVEARGQVLSFEEREGGARLRLRVPEGLASEAALGGSVAINGACLTVVARGSDWLEFDLVEETLRRTNLGGLRPGERVNLERALRADSRFEGHIVQGHVDATGQVEALEQRGEDVRLRVACGAELARWLVEKGSVAVDGVSLTIAKLEPDRFEVALIPHTLARTTLGERRPGDRVNLEADILGKYVHRYLERIQAGR